MTPTTAAARHVLVAAALLATAGCAADKTRPETPQAPPGPSLVDSQEQLRRAQRSLANMSEARHNLLAALAMVGVDISTTHDVELRPARGADDDCPSRVRDYAIGSNEDLSTHEGRLARALLMLDDELRSGGHDSLGCYVYDVR